MNANPRLLQKRTPAFPKEEAEAVLPLQNPRSGFLQAKRSNSFHLPACPPHLKTLKPPQRTA